MKVEDVGYVREGGFWFKKRLFKKWWLAWYSILEYPTADNYQGNFQELLRPLLHLDFLLYSTSREQFLAVRAEKKEYLILFEKMFEDLGWRLEHLDCVDITENFAGYMPAVLPIEPTVIPRPFLIACSRTGRGKLRNQLLNMVSTSRVGYVWQSIQLGTFAGKIHERIHSLGLFPYAYKMAVMRPAEGEYRKLMRKILEFKIPGEPVTPLDVANVVYPSITAEVARKWR